jgi:membrane protease YdiL (CAAX protease family)
VALVGVEDFDRIPLWEIAAFELPLWVGFVGVPLWASRTKGRGSLAADFGLRMEVRDIWVGLLCGFVGQLVLPLLLLPVYDLLGIDRDKVGDTAQKLADRAHDPFGVVCLFLVVVVGAAVFEELFYRGLWMRSIERRVGRVWAVILTAVLFGLMHFQPLDTFVLVGFGLIVGTLAARSGRLGPAIWAHVAFNLTALIALLWN